MTLKQQSDIINENFEYLDTQKASKTELNQTNNNLDALTGDVENIAGELDSKADKSEIPTKVSELQNDSNFTTETEVAQMIASIPQFEVKVVQELPETGQAMVLYLVPKDSEAPDVYLEYIWIATTQSFELIGSTTVDLSDYYTKGETNTLLNAKQNITDNNLVTTDKTVVGAVNELDAKIKEIELYKTPNVLIQGEPTINNGQVTGFSKTAYLILPFEFNVGDRAFELTYAFRTGSDITTAQNLFGSKFSIASFIQNGKLTIRISSNGISWDILDLITSLNIQPNTTYYIKLIFNRLNYTIKSSADGVEYTQIGSIVDTRPPFAGDVYIGIGNNTNNPFLGMINLHKWELKYNNSVFWEGMDDARLATRADISLSNLDEQGETKLGTRVIIRSW